MEVLKKTLKTWETLFFQENGRKPTKKDIKANKEIAAQYKEYGRLKKQQTSLSTPAKSDVSIEQSTPTKPKALLELGPTPQLNGRLVGIFELQTPAKDVTESPSFGRVKKVEFEEVNSDTEEVSKRDLTFKTPTHQRTVLISPSKTGTPGYLIQRAVVSMGSPSKSRNTIFSRGVKRRALSEIFKEVEQMKQSIDEEVLAELTEDLKEQQLLMDIEKEDQENGLVDDSYDLNGDMGLSKNEFETDLLADMKEDTTHKTTFWMKSKKIKRQTRKTKMKGTGNTGEAEIMDEEEINQEMVAIRQKLEEESEGEEEESEDESEVEEQEDDTEKENFMSRKIEVGETTGKKVIYRNFKRYKIQKGGRRGNWRRR